MCKTLTLSESNCSLSKDCCPIFNRMTGHLACSELECVQCRMFVVFLFFFNIDDLM